MPAESASVPAVAAYPSKEVLRDGIVTGLLGAATIMVWFLVLDTFQGRPLFTPTVLGTVITHRASEVTSLEGLPVSIPLVLLYTFVHTVAFCGVGLVAARLFAVAVRHPPTMFGLLLLFIFFFCGFVTVTLMFAPSVLEVVSIPAILAGNLLAAFVMGRHLWRRHPLDLRELL